jgi:hypothetical protein
VRTDPFSGRRARRVLAIIVVVFAALNLFLFLKYGLSSGPGADKESGTNPMTNSNR